MKKILLAIVCFLAPVASAYAQVPTAIARAACGAQSLTAGRYFPLAIDLTGNLCTSGGGGGGGGGAVTVADGADVTQGAKADSAYAGSGSASVVAILKGIYSSVNGSVPAGTAVIGALSANQSVNTAQVNGVTALTGTGAVGTGAQRVAVGTDTATIAGSAPGTAGSASANVVTVQGVASMTPMLNTLTTQYPSGAVAITASPSNGTTGAVVATLAHVTGHTVYICGFAARANATAATTVNLVVSGTITGSLNFLQWVAPLASGIGLTEEVFMPCVPASAINTDIVVTTGAPGTGGADSVAAWGYSL